MYKLHPLNSSLCVDCSFKSTKKLNYYTLGSLNKPTIPGNCIFSLTEPHSAECLYCVPESNPANLLILLYICSDNLKSDLLSIRPENILSFDRGKRLWLDFEV